MRETHRHNTAARILVIEDDAAFAASLCQLLGCDGHAVDIAATGQSGLDLCMQNAYDLVLLDLGLPDICGSDVLARLRAAAIAVRIMVVTGSCDEAMELAVLDAGADCVLVKPFDSAELLTRAATLLRHREDATARIIEIGGLRIDTFGKTAMAARRPLKLTVRQFDLLETLARRPDRVATRELLIDQLYGGIDLPASGIIDVFVHAIRKQLKGSGSCIETVRGSGFRLTVEQASFDWGKTACLSQTRWA